MIDHQEAWQVYAPNGSSLPSESILPHESRGNSDVIVGAVHIWMWRRRNNVVEVMLQHRAANKPTWPDRLDISVAGHVDAGETLAAAAVRECTEEVGVNIDSEKLEYFFSYRNFENGLKWVYLYKLRGDEKFEYVDGEVQDIRWVDLDSFVEMVASPNEHNLVPHPSEYYSMLVKALQRIA